MTLSVGNARPAELPELLQLRHEVFVVGQGVPEDLERDELDAVAVHAVARRGDRVIGTGRLVPGPGVGVATVGRMAVAEGERGTGVGHAVLEVLERLAAERGFTTVELHAQTHARGFYERAGYTAAGEEYAEAGIPHVTMRKPLA